jgi:glutamine synthetase
MDFDAASLRTACADLNGQMRGKRLPARHAAKLEFAGQRMPLSALSLDLWGRDIEGSPLVLASGDADGQLRLTERGPVPMPWLAPAPLLFPMWMFTEDGRPFDACPRHALARVLARYAKRGWKVTAATELEFTLLDVSGGTLAPVRDPATGHALHGGDINGVDALDAFARFFDDLYAGAEAMGIGAQAASSEAGVGQFELTLDHGPAMRMADDTWLAKALIRGMARRHGMAATFLAKPYPEDSGNGMHVHVSVTDAHKQNVFDNGLQAGSGVLKQAVAGCLSGMPGAMLVFAPHANSYARFAPGSHAPTGASWGYENRTAAIRIPGGDPAGRRLEHRMPGGDTNPYLVMAAILGAALNGIEDDVTPPPPVMGNAYAQAILKVPTDWDEAIARFETSPRMARVFPKRLIDMLVRVKRQEQKRTATLEHAAAAWLCHDRV